MTSLEAMVIRNIIMYTVVGAILLVAGFGIFNIISTITHEKTRDIAILKSLGLSAKATCAGCFCWKAGVRGRRLGSRLGRGLWALLCPVAVRLELSGAAVVQEITRLPLAWSLWHYAIAAGCALGVGGNCRLLAGAAGGAAQSG